MTNFYFIRKELADNAVIPPNERSDFFSNKTFKFDKLDTRLNDLEFVKGFFSLCKTLTKLKASQTSYQILRTDLENSKVDDFSRKNANQLISIDELIYVSKPLKDNEHIKELDTIFDMNNPSSIKL